MVNVPRISDQALASVLMTKMQISDEQAEKVAFMSDGDYNNALSVVAIETDVSSDFFVEWIGTCASGDALSIKDWVSRFVELGNEERNGTLLYFLKLMREMVHMRVLGDRLNKLKEQERDLIQKNVTLNKLGIEDIGLITDIVNNAIVMLERNANPRILMFHCSMQIEHIVKTSTLVTES
jgi:DNA polymerase-3 subunit delta'